MSQLQRMLEKSEKVMIISGEGYGEGIEEIFSGKKTARALKMALNRERCNSDRWAFAVIEDSDGDRFRYDNDDSEIEPCF